MLNSIKANKIEMLSNLFIDEYEKVSEELMNARVLVYYETSFGTTRTEGNIVLIINEYGKLFYKIKCHNGCIRLLTKDDFTFLDNEL